LNLIVWNQQLVLELGCWYLNQQIPYLIQLFFLFLGSNLSFYHSRFTRFETYSVFTQFHKFFWFLCQNNLFHCCLDRSPCLQYRSEFVFKTSFEYQIWVSHFLSNTLFFLFIHGKLTKYKPIQFGVSVQTSKRDEYPQPKIRMVFFLEGVQPGLPDFLHNPCWSLEHHLQDNKVVEGGGVKFYYQVSNTEFTDGCGNRKGINIF